MDSQIKLNRNDITKISNFLLDFKDSEFVTIKEFDNNCIGSVITASVETEVYEHKGTFTIEVSGVQDW